jgi:hypothetical protein
MLAWYADLIGGLASVGSDRVAGADEVPILGKDKLAVAARSRAYTRIHPFMTGEMNRRTVLGNVPSPIFFRLAVITKAGLPSCFRFTAGRLPLVNGRLAARGSPSFTSLPDRYNRSTSRSNNLCQALARRFGRSIK